MARGPKRHFTIGIVDDVTPRSVGSVVPTESADARPRCSTALAPTAPWAPTRTRSRSSARRRISTRRDTSSTTRKVRRDHRLAPANEQAADPVGVLVDRASFVACHQFEFVDKIDVLEHAPPGAAFLLNAPFDPGGVGPPATSCRSRSSRNGSASSPSTPTPGEASGDGTRINTIMQTCFFAISGLLPRDQAIAQIKKSIEKTYGKRGPEVVRRNCEVVDQALAHLHEVRRAGRGERALQPSALVSEKAPDFVQKVTAVMLAGKGDLLPVSAFPVDGTWPVATAKWEKRNIALEIPVWDSKICIQCNQCALVCPHAAIRAKVYDESALPGAPSTFKSTPYKGTSTKASATRSRSRRRTAPGAICA